MSLKAFHIVFVTLSSLLAFAFGGWSVHYFVANDDRLYLVLGLLSVALGVGLIFYGFWFWRKVRTRDEERKRRRKLMRTVPALIMVWMIAQRTAEACSTCYGDAEGPLIDGARMGVFLLFGLVLMMQISFASFFIILWRRARQHRPDGKESS